MWRHNFAVIACVVAVCATLIATVHCQKDGGCPPPVTSSVCHRQCKSDFDCSEQYKCCGTDCGGFQCTLPVSGVKRNNKYGTCPRDLEDTPWVCSSRCNTDADCTGKRKCCKNRCGALACLMPDGVF